MNDRSVADAEARAILDRAERALLAVDDAVAFKDRAARLRDIVAMFELAIARAETPHLRRSIAAHLGVLLAGENSVRDLDRALGLLRDATQTPSTDSATIRYFLGECYAMRGLYDEAEREWRAGLELQPGYPAIQAVLATLDVDRARGARDAAGVVAAVRRVPESRRNGELWLRLGDANYSLGQVGEAARAWTKAIALEPIKGMRRRFRTLTGRSSPLSPP